MTDRDEDKMTDLEKFQQANRIALEAQQRERRLQSIRYRINISRGMKGALSFECTVDAELPMPDVLQLSDELVAALQLRYPVTDEIRRTEKELK